MSELTPGPWTVREHDLSSSGDPLPAYSVEGPERTFPNLRPGYLLHREADARAIAAVPVLIAALKGVMADREMALMPEHWDQVEAALKEAGAD